MTDPINDLGCDAWLLLFALCVGDTIDIDDNHPVAVVTDGDGREVCRAVLDADVLDRLEDAGFIDHVDGGVQPSQRGRYWADKWIKKNFKGRKQAAVLTAARGNR